MLRTHPVSYCQSYIIQAINSFRAQRTKQLNKTSTPIRITGVLKLIWLNIKQYEYSKEYLQIILTNANIIYTYTSKA